jgi:hypothetical protein
VSHLRLDGFREHFPRLYADCFDFSVPSGWFDIVDALSGQLERMGVSCQQAKEKLGELRFYTGGLTAEAAKLVRAAEEQSRRTCQVCGEPGEANAYQGWVRTVCKEHR